MPFDANEDQAIARLMDNLHRATSASPELFADVVAHACVRFHAIAHLGNVRRFRELVATGAWLDAVLLLIAIELPQWSVRRLIYDAGHWHCSISKQPRLPEWLDEAIDVSHDSMPLAILTAFIEARQISLAPLKGPATSVPQSRPQPQNHENVLCCDNFR